MKFIRERVQSGEFLAGTWCNLGSSITVEMAGNAGFDWILIDLEHGSADYETLIHQLQAAESTPVAPIVRIAWNDPPRFKRVLDAGAAGIMIPYVSTVDEARLAASSMRYPPQGIRGVAKLNRATRFSADFEKYFSSANDNLLTVVQIETREAVENAYDIAGVEGIDVLFIGPLDLSINLGVREKFDHPLFRDAITRLIDACRVNNKAAGILLLDATQVKSRREDGFKFIALGSDGGMVAAGMRNVATALHNNEPE